MLSRASKVFQRTQLVRAFSASPMLVPLQPATKIPAEITSGLQLTQAAEKALQEQHEEYNKQCREELIEMQQTQISNIIDAGGAEGWDDHGDLSYLSKTFQFDTFEKGQDFVQKVGIFAETMDHHPEWECTNGGKTISVKLTSHFAGNTVTTFDF